MGRFTAAGERGTFAFRVGRPRLLETDYRSTFNSGCMTPTSEQVQLTSETDRSVSVSEVGVMFSWGFTSDCSGLLTF